MAGHTVLITGAGFSKPFGGPLLRELLSEGVRGSSRASAAALDALSEMVGSSSLDGRPNSLERAFSRLWEEQHTGLGISLRGNVWNAGDLLRELRLHLGSVAAKIRLDHRRPVARLLEGFLRQLSEDSKSLTVVTFNYDTLVEEALESLGLLYSYGPRKLVVFTDKKIERKLDKNYPDVEILKLHGSVNWGVCRECEEAPVGADLINAFHGVYVPPRNASCYFCNKRYLVPSIVPPILTKGSALQSLGGIWQRAYKLLPRSREILVVGYSLPEGDAQAVSLLSTLEGPLKRPRIRLVCGERGATSSLKRVLPSGRDLKSSFEDFLAAETS